MHYYKQNRKCCSIKCVSVINSNRQKGKNNIACRKDVREKISIAHKGIKRPLSDKLKISNTMKNKYINGELIHLKDKTKTHKQNIGKAMKKVWNKKEYKLFAKNRRINQKFNKTSKAEIYIQDFLEKNNIKYIAQWRYKHGVADFYLPDKNLIIESNGIYWHNKPDYIIRDKKKYSWLKNNGYKLLVVCSEDIVNKHKKGEQILEDLQY